MMRTVAEAVTTKLVVPPEPAQHQQVPVAQGAPKKRETALGKVVRQLTQSTSSADPVATSEEEAPVPKLTRPSGDKRQMPTPRTKARAATARSPHKDSGDATVSVSGSGSKCGSSSKVELVLSLYGDGFIEIPPSHPKQETTALRKGFSLKIRLFKAADIEKDTSHCYTEESRHTNPELDDSGEFVRWTCCGSTDSSVYGCSAAKAIQSRASTALRDKDMPAPKLIAAKLPNPNQSDGISFSIYDRGTSSENSVRAQGAGEGAQYSLDPGCHVWFKGYECWANRYTLPSNRWVLLYVTFDCRYLQLYVDENLVDSASIIAAVPRNAASNKSSTNARGNPGGGGQAMWAAAASSNVNSIYIGGHPSYSRSVRDWRLRIGFIGLIASVTMWKVSDALSSHNRGLKETDNVSSAESDVDLVKTSAVSNKRSGDHAVVLKILFNDERVLAQTLPSDLRAFIGSKIISLWERSKQSRMEDLPTLSKLTPTASGMYALPLLESLSICATLDCEGSVVRSPWRFIGVFLDHDFQLLEFIHEECPVSQDGTTSFHQARYLYGGFVHRVNLHLSHIPSRVYCILFCLQKIGYEENAVSEAESGIKKSCVPGFR